MQIIYTPPEPRPRKYRWFRKDQLRDLLSKHGWGLLGSHARKRIAGVEWVIFTARFETATHALYVCMRKRDVGGGRRPPATHWDAFYARDASEPVN